MPVDTTHKDYAAMLPLWQMIRDAVAGELTVKTKGTAYLPMLVGMEDMDYQMYKTDARFYNMVAHSITGYLGAAFRTPPVIEAPDEVLTWTQDITMSGVSIEGFLKQEVQDKLITGRYGILVDRAPKLNSRVTWSAYAAESISLWRKRLVNGVLWPSLVVLKEQHEEPGSDEFEFDTEEQYRVLDLDKQGLYRQRLYRQVGTGADEEWVQVAQFEPDRQEQRLDFIPFVFDGLTGLTMDIEKPPLADLAFINFGHYRVTADYYDALVFTSKPQSVIFSNKELPSKLRVGSRVAWQLNPEDSTDYLEYTGAGIGGLRQALQDDEERGARLGASVIMAPRATIETAETARIHESGKSSILASIVGTTGDAATQALRYMAWWGLATKVWDDPAIRVKMNTEFVESHMSPDELEALFRVQQAGGISRDTYLYNVKRGDLIPQDRSIEDEKALIDSDPPPLPRGEPENLDVTQDKEAA